MKSDRPAVSLAGRAGLARAFHQSRWRLSALAVMAVLGAAGPMLFDISTLRLATELLTLLAFAQMWNLLAGYAGLVSVGQQAFVGIGAYALFASSDRLVVNPFVCTAVAVAVTGLLAAVFTPLLFRLRGAYFAIGTWVLSEMLRIASLNSEWLGAGAGMNLETVGDMDRWVRAAGAYWLAFGSALVSILLIIGLNCSDYGLALTATRDNEEAAASLGVNVERLKGTLFIIVASITGGIGGIAYINVLQVNPDAVFSVNWTAYAIFIVIIGGIGTIEGPILGAVLFFALRETFSDYGAWYLIAIGTLAVATMMFAPNGIWGLLSQKLRRNVFAGRRDVGGETEKPYNTVAARAQH